MDKANAKGETINELLEAQAHVWNHIFSFINSMSLKCAVDLGIPDIIHNHGKPMTVSKLVAALPILNSTKARNLYRFMRIYFTRASLTNKSLAMAYKRMAMFLPMHLVSCSRIIP
ncbi:hypothetical protein V6N11_044993 [Hibiscus sabdariffa]|uniref:O-methyltransferase dimerisation domain-containing protein n=1 Tax=Hibiscus sabdariffa TaxID=183260 RepID=A0ABR2PV53_9ROSI